VSNDHVHAHLRAILDNIANTHRYAREELREGAAAINRVNRQTMSYLRTRDDEDPEYRTSEEEMAEAEIANQARIIADLETALEKIADIAGDYGDGAPDSHYLAVLMLELESIATRALDEARGTHRKALESYKRLPRIPPHPDPSASARRFARRWEA
jgi:hypothetical protein